MQWPGLISLAKSGLIGVLLTFSLGGATLCYKFNQYRLNMCSEQSDLDMRQKIIQIGSCIETMCSRTLLALLVASFFGPPVRLFICLPIEQAILKIYNSQTFWQIRLTFIKAFSEGNK